MPVRHLNDALLPVAETVHMADMYYTHGLTQFRGAAQRRDAALIWKTQASTGASGSRHSQAETPEPVRLPAVSLVPVYKTRLIRRYRWRTPRRLEAFGNCLGQRTPAFR